MSRKWIFVPVALIVLALGLAACGDDDDETTTDAATTEETTTDEAAGGGGGEGGTIKPAAVPSGDLAYETGKLEVDAGEVTIEFDNPSPTPHDVQIETPDGETVGGTDVITGDSTSTTVTLSEPGEYVYYCSVDAHRQAGMEETLEVK